MRTKFIYIFHAVISVFLLLSCSTQKNTAYRRFYHNFTTRYNVYFNANEAYKKGEKKIEERYQPDYSHIIDVFPLSSATTKGVAKTDMTTVQTKCQKAIKEHSIRKKPKKNPKKTRDPKYMEFFNKEEFNTKMYDVWMLYGKSQMDANEYLAASATFSYVIKHFPEDKKIQAEANIWKARALKELEWTYEAESILENMDDEAFDESITCFSSETLADLKIKNEEYEDALPLLLSAIELEKKRKTRIRLTFIAAQICQHLGKQEQAYELYGKVIKSSPDYQMAFNARIRQTEVYGGHNKQDLVKELAKMAKKQNNKDYLDQIYYAIGNVYLKSGDTTQAIESYKTAVEKSTRNGLDKAMPLVTMGNLYYEQGKYIDAQPCYADASVLISQDYPNYKQINERAQVLGELAQHNWTVTLQDSLQALGQLPKNEQIAAANREIEKIRQQEEAERERQRKEDQKNKQLETEIENMAVMDRRAMGGVQTADWYFYNARTVSKGKLEFQRKFGNRRLEDNWNRKNKSFVAISEEIAENEEVAELDNEDTKEAKTLNNGGNNNATDTKNVQFYLSQIPTGREQIDASNKQIADALYQMGVIYEEKLNDYRKAQETYSEFTRRFPNDNRAADVLFYCYKLAQKTGDNVATDGYKNELLTSYPESKYSKILTHPDFRAQIERMEQEQDSIYENTYRKYLKGEFNEVMANANSMEQTYPMSPLLPKFMLLKSLSAGKAGDRDSLKNSLKTLLHRYPNSTQRLHCQQRDSFEEIQTERKDPLPLLSDNRSCRGERKLAAVLHSLIQLHQIPCKRL